MPNINKVVFGNNTLVDMTDATAVSSDLMLNKTAYGASGAKITGSFDLESFLFAVSKLQDQFMFPGIDYESTDIMSGRLSVLQERIGYPGVYPSSGRESETLISDFQDRLGYPGIFVAEYDEETS